MILNARGRFTVIFEALALRPTAIVLNTIKATELGYLFEVAKGDDLAFQIQDAFCSECLQDTIDMHDAQSKGVGELRLGDRKFKLLVGDHTHRSKPLAQFCNQIGHASRSRSRAKINDPLPEQRSVKKRFAPERPRQGRSRIERLLKLFVIDESNLRL